MECPHCQTSAATQSRALVAGVAITLSVSAVALMLLKILLDVAYAENKEKIDAFAVSRMVAFVNGWWDIGQNKVCNNRVARCVLCP